MLVSIIIPTYNRSEDLDKCFNSIAVQTTFPKEIIIVDDSENDKIKNLIGKRKKEFEGKKIVLQYIRNKKEKSLTIARNIGVENSSGDIILFLDSDVILDRNYIKEILNVYKEKQNALGVQGHITNGYSQSKMDSVSKNFYVGHVEKNKCRVLPSTQTTYPYFIDKVISCEWLSGSNQSYRKEIFEEFKFDEKLKRYAYKEDVDFSYRIFKKYPDSLFMTPYAKLMHNVSDVGRIPKEGLTNLKEIYSLYFFLKNINQTFKNKLIFLWSRAGYLILNLTFRREKRIAQFKYQISAYLLCIKHLGDIKRGDIDFLK